MGAIEPARQAGSTDTNLNHELDHDGFAVWSLFYNPNVNRISVSERRLVVSKLQTRHKKCTLIIFQCGPQQFRRNSEYHDT